jgi:predicted nucleic acid-binding protein
LNFFRTLAGRPLGISAVSYIEVLIGAEDEKDDLRIQEFFSYFEVVSVNTRIARDAARWIRRRKLKNLRNSGFADTIIGYTALALNVPLITNNPKDFSVFPGLKTVVPE